MKKHLLHIILLYLGTSLFAQNWEQVGEGLSPHTSVGALHVDTVNDYLYVGGNFEKLENGKRVGAYGLVRFKHGKMEILDSVWNNSFLDFQEYKGDLYFVGDFDHLGGKVVFDTVTRTGYITGGIRTRSIGRLHHDTFQMVNPDPLRPEIFCLTVHDGKLVVGGAFEEFAGIKSNGIVTYDSNKFSTIGGGVLNKTSPPYVIDLHSYKGQLFAGGRFYSGNSTNPVDETTRNLQVYQNDTWKRVAGWITKGTWSTINSFEVFKEELYIAGYFELRHGDIQNHIVKYDGQSFYSLGSGLNHAVMKLNVIDEHLFVVGNFDNVDQMYSSRIAKWNGESWCRLSIDTFNQNIEEIILYNDTVHILGNFSKINNVNILSLAKWIGDPAMEDSCAPPAEIKKVNYNLGIDKQTLFDMSVSIYPNPARQQIKIKKLKNTGSLEFILMDVQGNIIKAGKAVEIETSIDISDIASGVYLLNVVKDKNTINKRIIIE